MSWFAWGPTLLRRLRRRPPPDTAEEREPLPPAERRRRQASAACLGGILLLAAVVVGLYVRDDGKLSPVDEMQHVDYLDKAAHLHVPRLGELVGPLARHEIACRTVEAKFDAPPCAQAETAPSSMFPENGIDTAGADPPTYYFITGVLARGVRAVLHLGSVVTAARLLGFLWLAAGLIVLWLAMGELGIGILPRSIVAALMVTTPIVVLSSASVTSDATLMLAGAASLYTVLRWERGALPGWPVLVVAALCGFTKVPALVATGCVTIYLLVRWLRSRRGESAGGRTPRQLLTMAVAAPLAAIVLTGIWHEIVVARTIPGVPTSVSGQFYEVTSLPVTDALLQVRSTLSPLLTPSVNILAPLHDSRVIAMMNLVNLLIIAASFGGAALAFASSRLEAVASSAAVLMLVSGPLFVVFIYVSTSQDFSIPPRYGLALVPFAAAALAAALHKRWIRFITGGFGVLVVVYTLVHLATFAPI